MSSKLYVGNLDFKASEEELQSLFERVGAVKSVKVIRDKFTGQSRGFGFVEMDTDDLAQNAISELNGEDFLSRPLRVSIAQEREEGGGRPRRNFGGGNGGGGRPRRQY